jgi:hypothetical protein
MGARTYWSAPVPQLGFTSLAVLSFTTATLTDISPYQVILQPGMLEVGTRVRIRAYGEYTATTTASTLTWGFYMNSTLTNNIATTPATLAATASTAAVVATAWPWMLDYEGQIRAITDPTVGATNAQIYGMGKSFLPVTNITSWTLQAMPITSALRTVQQTATGLVTNIAQTVSVGLTVGTNTGFTSATCDELTVELLG